jgi:hypothetical protein
VVGNLQLLPEQPGHVRGEALSLMQDKVEDEPQHQHQFDRRVRIPGLAAGRGSPRRLLPRNGSLIEPERQVTKPPQPGFVDRPVLDPIAGLRNAMTAGSIVLERHARERNGSTAPWPARPSARQLDAPMPRSARIASAPAGSCANAACDCGERRRRRCSPRSWSHLRTCDADVRQCIEGTRPYLATTNRGAAPQRRYARMPHRHARYRRSVERW